MKVDPKRGRVEFAQGYVEPGIDKSAFLASTLGRSAEVVVDNEPYVTYRIRPEHGVAAIVSFVGARLRNVSWQFALSAEKESVWSEALELERKRVHDDWLHANLGAPPYCFAWGQLVSVYDPKGCVSDIILSYEK